MSLSTLKKRMLILSGGLKYYWKRRDPGIYVFNFHRLGNPALTDFDPNVFSCTTEKFTKHVSFIAENFKVLDVEGLHNLLENDGQAIEPVALITFDDGYQDNFSEAFPQLRKLGVPATFFLPFDYIGSNQVPWWDEIAWLVRNCYVSSLSLPNLEKPIRIDQKNISRSVRMILRYVKDIKSIPLDEKLDLIKTGLGLANAEVSSSDLFLTWNQVSEMSAGGMGIGSHACSHQILSQLSVLEQKKEIFESRAKIGDKLGKLPIAFAYPVGGLDSYTEQTLKLVIDAGYKLGFTFPLGGGINTKSCVNRFEIARLGVDFTYGVKDLMYAVKVAARY